MSRCGAGFVVAVAVLVTAGCAGQPARPAGELRIEPAWSSCAAQVPTSARPELPGATDTASLPRLDDTFRPVAAVVCSRASLSRAGGGADLTATESRADDVTALVAALRLPDEPRTDDPCTMELYLPPFLALLDDRGRWVRPGMPYDACGKVRVEVRDALQGLRLTPVSVRPTGEIESSAAAAAGCSQQWADMVWVAGESGTRGEPAVVPPGFDGPVQVRLCVYRVPADQQRTGKPAGEFVSGRFLTDAQATTFRREVESAGAAPACPTPANRFAVLHLGAGQIYAELDGCRRVLAQGADGSQTLRQASPALLTLLAG